MHHMSLYSIITLLSCIVIFVRVATFRRRGRPHRLHYALAAWGLCALSAIVGVKVALGMRPPVGPVEAFCMLALAIGLLIVRGNVAHLVKWSV